MVATEALQSNVSWKVKWNVEQIGGRGFDLVFGLSVHVCPVNYTNFDHLGREMSNDPQELSPTGKRTYNDPRAKMQQTEILVLLSRLAPLINVAGRRARMRSATIPIRTAKYVGMVARVWPLHFPGTGGSGV